VHFPSENVALGLGHGHTCKHRRSGPRFRLARKLTVPNLLSIAGLDPSGGAGIAADLKTFAALSCHGMAVVTAITVQNTQRVFDIHCPPPELLAAQIDAIFADIDVAAVKIGMLGSVAIVDAVAARLSVHRPPFIVLDPVLTATSGDTLAGEGVAEAIIRHLLPLATLITPNLSETAALASQAALHNPEHLREAAARLHALGGRAILITGGDAEGETSVDLLFDGGETKNFSAPRIATRSTHGTGCTLSSAIAAYLAHGLPLVEAIAEAKAYVSAALAAAYRLDVGRGRGPVHHFHELWRG
jgi:hydroxymethylpyrimidine/phosphomethylpyrimidine kinase